MADVGSISGQPSFQQSSAAQGGTASTGDISGDFVLGGGGFNLADLSLGKTALLGGIVIFGGALWLLLKK